jgi:phosphatidylglycerophosphatase C
MLNKTKYNIVAYFDFDGTLTKYDTLLPFVIYVVGYRKFIMKLHLLVPILILYWCKIINNEIAKQSMLRTLLKNYSKQFIENKAQEFAKNKLCKWLNPFVLSRMNYHKEHNHKIIIVSANLATYLRYWASAHKLDGVIATEIEFVNNVCSGNLSSPNCYGAEKIMRIKQYLSDNNINFDYSYGYGNSHGDYQLLLYVNEAYWINKNSIVAWNEYRNYRKTK